MHATTIRFTAPANADWEALRHHLVRLAFEMCHKTPGLHSTALTVAPERREFGGNYVWESQGDADAFLRSDLWKGEVARHGQPRLERAEVGAYIEEGDVLFPADFEERLAGSQPEQPSSRH